MAVLASGLAPSAWGATQRQDPLAELDRDQRRVFQAYTRLFCTQFFRFGEDRFVLLPNHASRRENSTGRTADEVKDMLTVTRTIGVGLHKHDKKFYPPEAEVVARSMLLPYFDVGHYGHLNSVRVKEIVGPDEMIVTAVELIPREHLGKDKNEGRKYLYDLQRENRDMTFRLLGFRTKGLEVGESYSGPRQKGLHVAIMSTDQTHDFVMVNYDKLERIRTSEFHEALSYVKISPLAFLDMVRDNREQDYTTGDIKSLISIYRRYYDRYRPERVSAAPEYERSEPATGATTTPRADSEPAVASQPESEDRPQAKPRDYDRTVGAPDKPQVSPGPVSRPERPAPSPQPREAEPVEDDWEPDDNASPNEVTFFGIPLGE